ncbi:hypothetical protein BU15DRAFT_13769, partial [Melanogaster broomeanus]
IEALQRCGFTPTQFFISLLTSQQHNDNQSIHDLLTCFTDIFSLLINHPLNDNKLIRHASEIVQCTYLMELKKIASEDGGWHFGALSTTTKQLEDFSLEDMAWDMETYAPELCRMIGSLL